MVIEIETKSVYGTVKFYPHNQAAKLLAALAKTKTLSVEDLNIAKMLDFEVKEVHVKHLGVQ